MPHPTKHKPGARRLLAIGLACLCLSGCYGRPSGVQDLCAVFRQRPDWYTDARRSSKHWHIPISVQMAILLQESTFRPEARPARRDLLGFIPWTRPSSAYGYAQASNATWARYRRATGDPWAARDNFAAAVYFVGWYAHRSVTRSGIAADNAFRQYLAYHEGHNGYNHGSYRGKRRLLHSARHVATVATRYRRQLKGCRASLNARRWWWPF